MDIRKEALEKHYEWHGKIRMTPQALVYDRADLALSYIPGVAEPCLTSGLPGKGSFRRDKS